MGYIGNLEKHNARIGKLGEDLACEYLESLGHVILERNYRNKFGEIDIVSMSKSIKAGLESKIHIVEVKTSQSRQVRPEENMNRRKMLKVARLGEIYTKGRLFSVDFVGVTLNSDRSLNSINYIDNLEIY